MNPKNVVEVGEAKRTPPYYSPKFHQLYDLIGDSQKVTSYLCTLGNSHRPTTARVHLLRGSFPTTREVCIAFESPLILFGLERCHPFVREIVDVREQQAFAESPDDRSCSLNGKRQRRSRFTISGDPRTLRRFSIPMRRGSSSWNASSAPRGIRKQASFGYSRTSLVPPRSSKREREQGEKRPSSRTEARHPLRGFYVVENTASKPYPSHQPTTPPYHPHDSRNSPPHY